MRPRWSYYAVTREGIPLEVVKAVGKRHVKDVFCAEPDHLLLKVELINQEKVLRYLVSRGLEEKNIRTV